MDFLVKITFIDEKTIAAKQIDFVHCDKNKKRLLQFKVGMILNPFLHPNPLFLVVGAPLMAHR